MNATPNIQRRFQLGLSVLMKLEVAYPFVFFYPKFDECLAIALMIVLVNSLTESHLQQLPIWRPTKTVILCYATIAFGSFLIIGFLDGFRVFFPFSKEESALTGWPFHPDALIFIIFLLWLATLRGLFLSIVWALKGLPRVKK